MVQLIVGKKGKGKTKQLLDKVNSEVKEISGNIVYLDKSSQHMYELNNKVRLIDVSQCSIENSSEFIGFVCGIMSQDHDLQQMYFDSFLKISCLENGGTVKQEDLTAAIEKLEKEARSLNYIFYQTKYGRNVEKLADRIAKDVMEQLNLVPVYDVPFYEDNKRDADEMVIANSSDEKDEAEQDISDSQIVASEIVTREDIQVDYTQKMETKGAR